MKRIFYLLIIALLSAFEVSAQGSWPQFYVKDLSGNTRKFSHYAPEKGVTLFVFWKTCCPNNITMIEELNEVWQEYDNPEQPVKIVLVSIDDQRTASRVRPIVSTNGWEWDVIMDRNGEMARRYNVIIPPQWIAIDTEGKVIFQSKVTNGALDSAIYFEDLTNQLNKTN
jgi:cytochrome c biogenesis protein CcmG/thiol:disulfide interchange protein DsbE